MSDNLNTEKKLETIRKISSLADGVTLEYVQSLSDIICDPDTELAEKRKAYREMDKVLRIAKQYSDRVLLAEGKTTENIGINGKGGLPFKVIFTETFEGLPPENEQSDASYQLPAEDAANE